MSIEENKVLGLSIKTLIALICSMLAGSIFFGFSIFQFHSHCSVINVFGITFALFYFSINTLGLKRALLLVTLLVFLEEILFRKNMLYHYWEVISDISYFGLMVLSTYLFNKIIHKENLKTHVLVYPILGIFFFLGAVLHYLILVVFFPNIYEGIYALYMISIPEFLSGMGISIGIYLCERTKLMEALNGFAVKLSEYKF